MKNGKRSRLPQGLRWRSESKYIWFIWYDSKGRQHKKSTETTDPVKALRFKLDFLEGQETKKTDAVESPDLGNQPLGEVAELYFAWKLANSSAETVRRERRMFKSVLNFFGRQLAVKLIRLPKIRLYQIERRQQISPTMKQLVSARTVNYEMQLLRAVMEYADCWSDHLAARYKPLRQMKSRRGKAATKQQLIKLIRTAMANDYWQVVMYCAAVAAGSGCRGGEIRTLHLSDIDLEGGTIRIAREIAKNRTEREPRLMALAEWGLRNLLERAQALGAADPDDYLLPFKVSQSSKLRSAARGAKKWDVTKPMITWVKSWRKLTEKCGMAGFRFHDLRHTFRTFGAEAGVPLEVMMAQLGHMDRETSLEYVHIQQRALERAKQLIEAEQAEILESTRGGPQEECVRSGRGPILDMQVEHASAHPAQSVGRRLNAPVGSQSTSVTRAGPEGPAQEPAPTSGIEIAGLAANADLDRNRNADQIHRSQT